jgi:hypothetical protein
MIYLRRVFMVSAALVAIHMQGCGCDDDKKYYPPPQDSFAVNGAASKGILRNFDVSAYRFTSGILDPTPITTSVTNNLGQFTLNIPTTYSAQPLLYRVTPRTESVMTCDLSAGCGDGVAFGQDLPITDSNFQLSSVVPRAESNPVANISMFTDLASSLVLESEQASNEAIMALIEQSNSRVANRFGIVGNLTTLPIIDLTNRAAVEAAINAGNSAHIQYAAMNSAVAQAVLGDSTSGTTFASALNAFRDYFAGGGIAGNTEATGITSYADILSSARLILDRVSVLNPQAPLNFSALQQYLTAEQELANNEQPDSRSTGTPSSTSGATPIAKVKAMVSDLKNLAISLGDTAISGGTIGGISEDFAMQLEAAEMASSENAGHLIEAMAIAAAAIDDANRAHSNNLQLTAYASDTGVNVTITVEGEATHFSVDQDIEVETDTGATTIAVELNASDALTFAETDTTGSVEMTADGGYEVMGSATSSTLTMAVKEGSSISVEDMAVVESVDMETSELSEDQSLDLFDLNLMIELSQLATDTVTDPVTLEGSLVASLSDVMIVDTESATTETSTSSLGMVSLKLSGLVSNMSGESASFAVSVSGDGTGVSFVDTWTQQGEASTGETTSNFVDMYGSLAFTAELTGNPNVVSMNYSIARTGVEDADNSLSIRYPGKQFRFNMLVADGAPEGNLTITNQDGVLMSLMETTVEGESRLQGTISLNGTQYATVEEDDTVIIRYSDGSFESL